MKKLNLINWQSVPPSMIFSDKEVSHLKFTQPERGKEHIDPLTGVPNRRAFDETISEVVQQANRQSAGFGLIIFDIDHFKAINDNYGHPKGDAVLKNFAFTIKSVLRNEDFLGRIGGEEFAVITPAWDKVFDLGERVRKAVETKTDDIKVTCSFGCAQYPGDAFDRDRLYELADKALYKAKENGRNQGCLFSD